jgi:magnesium chelatase accessory protein
MGDRLNFDVEGRDWPHRAASRFVTADGIAWHVQVIGTGPALLLVHGTGASSHSWRDLMEPLAAHFTLIVPDLPGHGFTAMPSTAFGLSLPGMSQGLAALMDALKVSPQIAVGHSAGAAILARMSIDQRLRLKTLVSYNGAILPLGGVAGRMFSPIAKALVGLDFVPRWAARRNADPTVIADLLRNTGSKLDPRGTELYARLAKSPGHVAAALGMMANWDLMALERDLGRLTPHVVLVAGGRDAMIKPEDSFRVKALLPDCEVVFTRDLGHLAHEERPTEAVYLIKAKAAQAKILETLP